MLSSKKIQDFQLATELSSSAVGGEILFATDDFFAPAESLVSPEDPVWKEEEYTTFGKWMDGWETRRKRIAGHDWAIVKLGVPGEINAIHFDTAFFTGNQTPAVSVQAARLDSVPLKRRSEMGTACTEEELKAAEAIGSDKWEEILPKQVLNPGYPETRHHIFELNAKKPFTHLRINMYPDGGIARMHVFGVVERDWTKWDPKQLVDLARVDSGGRALGFTDAHYGKPPNLISLGRAPNMKYGWETKRNPDRPSIFVYGDDGHLIIPGKHSCVLRLGHRGVVDNIEVDTNWFKGNFPESCLIEALDLPNAPDSDFMDMSKSDNLPWKTLLPRTKLAAHQQAVFGNEKMQNVDQPITHVRLTIYPDGGISRLRINGYIV